VEYANSKPGNLKGYDCPICMNRGYSMVLTDGEMRARECSCMAIRKSLKRAKDSGLGKLLESKTFGSFQTPEPWQEEAKRMAKAYAAEPEGWFVFSGNSGSGKTHLCTAICRKLLADGRAVQYVLWRDLAQKMKSSAMNASVREEIVRPLRNVEVLYIDDFLKTPNNEGNTKPDVGAALDILGPRYNAGALTVLSTELSLDHLMSLDEAMGSRIYEMTDKGQRFIEAVGGNKNWRLRSREEGPEKGQ